MLRLENVATPLAAASVVVPDSVPLLGFVPIATVTPAVKVGSVLSNASCAVTWTPGVIAAPAVVVLGCTVNISCVAAPGVMLNGVLVAPPSPVALAVSVYPVPVLLMARLENIATPFTAATVAAPERVPPPGFAPRATVTLAAKVGSVF